MPPAEPGKTPRPSESDPRPADRGAGAGNPADTDREAEEELHEALEDSFPASDPPAITQPVHRHDDEKS